MEFLYKDEAEDDLAGKWSRRINRENRIIYSVENNIITVYSLRGHYD